MKTRAILLLALVLGGAYTMIQSYSEDNEKYFADLYHAMDSDFHSLIFNRPPMLGTPKKTWIVDDPHEVEELLHFLQDYQVKKLAPEEVNVDDDIDEFSIVLQDDEGNTLTVVITEDLIIQNSKLYYKIVDGPLDVRWLVRFFAENPSS